MAFSIGDLVAHKSNPTVSLVVTEEPSEYQPKYTVTRFCKEKGQCTPVTCMELELEAYVAP